MSIGGVLQRALALVLLLFGALGVYLALRLLWSALASLQVGLFLEDWEQRSQPPTEVAWTVAETAAQRALAWHPVPSSQLWVQRAIVYEWASFGHGIGDPDARKQREQALADYRVAREARPLWPYYSLYYANVKWLLDEPDAEFHAALADAWQHGPHRPLVQQEIARLGAMNWANLSIAERSRTLQATGQVFRHHRQLARDLWPWIVDAGLEWHVCTYLRVQLGENTRYWPAECRSS